MSPLYIIDLETTGLLPDQHEIIEIGAVRVGTGETLEIKVHPMRIGEADPVALQINGYNRKDWEEAFLLPNALKLLSKFVGQNAFMMAYNVSFDRAFLEKAYRDCRLGYPFHYNHIDLLSIAFFKLGSPMSLKNACKALNIPPEPQIHRAGSGARKALEVYQELTANLKGI